MWYCEKHAVDTEMKTADDRQKEREYRGKHHDIWSARLAASSYRPRNGNLIKNLLLVAPNLCAEHVHSRTTQILKRNMYCLFLRFPACSETPRLHVKTKKGEKFRLHVAEKITEFAGILVLREYFSTQRCDTVDECRESFRITLFLEGLGELARAKS